MSSCQIQFDVGTDTYDSSRKQRVPSWTDRVLFKSKTAGVVICNQYDSLPALRSSDHKPVVAAFSVTLTAAADSADQASRIDIQRATRNAILAFRQLSTSTMSPKLPRDGSDGLDQEPGVQSTANNDGFIPPDFLDSSESESDDDDINGNGDTESTGGGNRADSDGDNDDDYDSDDAQGTVGSSAMSRVSETTTESCTPGRGSVNRKPVMRKPVAAKKAPQSAVCAIV